MLDAVGAAILGHGHESIRRAVKEQVDGYVAMARGFEPEVPAAAARRGTSIPVRR